MLLKSTRCRVRNLDISGHIECNLFASFSNISLLHEIPPDGTNVHDNLDFSNCICLLSNIVHCVFDRCVWITAPFIRTQTICMLCEGRRVIYIYQSVRFGFHITVTCFTFYEKHFRSSYAIFPQKQIWRSRTAVTNQLTN